jgi:phospholipid/cholesterol/gamma-HCH transport system substrate-binding protein
MKNMADQTSRNIRLGMFITAGIAFTVLLLYMIGSGRNLFSSSFEISATFNNVNGLLPGNNVRLSGIDVGTVKRIRVTSDSTVQVYMIIARDMRKFIRKNSIASVGTDGLMGSKLVNINSVTGEAAFVSSGDTLRSLRPIESDEMLRTLNTTNLNLARITTDMRMITHKLNSSSSLWSMLQDSVIAENLKSSIRNIEAATGNANLASEEFNDLLKQAGSGHGILGTVLADSSVANEFKAAIRDIRFAGKQIQSAAGGLEELSKRFKEGKGTIDLLLIDTAFRTQVNKSMRSIRSASEKLDEDMDALRESFLLRRYFKKSEKEKSN